MTNNNTAQRVLINRVYNKPLHVPFDQPDSSSDGGAVLLKAADQNAVNRGIGSLFE